MIENNVKVKSYDFALKVVHTYQGFSKEQQDFFLSKLLVQKGTSIGVKLEGVLEKDSRKELFIKLSVSLKEIKEARYILHLLRDIGYLPEERCESLKTDCDELFTMLGNMTRKIKRFML